MTYKKVTCHQDMFPNLIRNGTACKVAKNYFFLHLFIIVDESQNTTSSQMKMFLTRIGFGSTAVITGDVTQIDLPKGTRSGLVQVSTILDSITEIGFTYFSAKDVVRHRLVQQIVEAYDAFDKKTVSKINSKDSSQINERDS